MAVVSVISSSVCLPNPEIILVSESTDSFRSDDSPYEWVCWTFHFRQLVVSHYTIRSDALRSWVLEASPNGQEWFEIDRQTKTCDIKRGSATATFSGSHGVATRYIRLVQIGCNHQGTNGLSLSAVVFFGTLFERRHLESFD
jgi:hypothetical protein